MSVLTKISNILNNKMGIAHSEITLDANFTKDLGIDSLDYAEFVLLMEQEFKVKIPYHEAEKIATINEAIRYIENKIRAK